MPPTGAVTPQEEPPAHARRPRPAGLRWTLRRALTVLDVALATDDQGRTLAAHLEHVLRVDRRWLLSGVPSGPSCAPPEPGCEAGLLLVILARGRCGGGGDPIDGVPLRGRQAEPACVADQMLMVHC